MVFRKKSNNSESATPAARPVPPPNATFYSVAKTSKLAPGEMTYVEVGPKEEPICLINLDGEFYALYDCCTHEDASLSDGTIVGDEIECPLHGGAFEIRNGQPAAFPVVVPVRTYFVRVEGDDIQVSLDRVK